MRWDEVLTAVGAEAAADPALIAVYGDAIRQAGTAGHVVPLLEIHLITDTENNEIWAPHIIQFSQWTDTQDQLIISERALKRLFHQDIPVWIKGVYMWSEFTDGAGLVDDPDRWNYYGRALRFRMTPVREDYSTPVGS